MISLSPVRVYFDFKPVESVPAVLHFPVFVFSDPSVLVRHVAEVRTPERITESYPNVDHVRCPCP